jgi:prolyl-tRNA editing enzyme YbaK/EbsC (Cys-tRNA(Pro) deacylase)
MVEAEAGGIEDAVLTRLAELQIEHEVLPCDPELADTAAFCAHYGHPLDRSANTIVVAARREPGVACACVALATCRLDVNHAVCDLLGVRKASFASPEQTRELTGMMIGGVTPFGLPDGLPLFIDAAVMDRDTVILGGGSRSIKLRVAPAALQRLPGARVVAGLAAPVAAP